MTIGEMIDVLKEYPPDATMTFTSWIPVTTRLPKAYETVIVTMSDGTVGVTNRWAWPDGEPVAGDGRDGNGFVRPSGHEGDVIAWQYFPVPYTGREISKELKV